MSEDPQGRDIMALSIEHHKETAERWKAEAGATLAELLRVRSERDALREAVRESLAWLGRDLNTMTPAEMNEADAVYDRVEAVYKATTSAARTEDRS